MKVRKSNFELLRIIAMLLIIMHHYIYHSGIYPTSFTDFNNMSIFIQFVGSFGKFGTTIFVLISSNFLIEKEIKYKSLIPLIIKMYFYSILMLIVVLLFTQETISVERIYRAFFPTIWGNWYLIYYILLFLFLPFLNNALTKLSKPQFKYLVILIIIIWSIIPTLTEFNWSLGNFDYILFVYIIGAYIKLHFIETKNKSHYLKVLISTVVLMLLCIIVSDYLGIYFQSDKIFNYYQSYNQLNSFLPLISSIYLFLYFKNIDFKSNTINFFSSSVVSIYLIHDNNVFRNVLWNSFFPNLDYINTNLFIPHFILKVLFVFFICVFVDKVFAYTLEKPLNNIVKDFVSKIEKVIQNKQSPKYKPQD